MHHQPEKHAKWGNASQVSDLRTGLEGSELPEPKDSETLITLRQFLEPILTQAQSWQDLYDTLARKGYGLAFRQGHLVILDDRGQAMCTGSSIGAPLRKLADRMGRPCIRASANGQTGKLQ